MKKNLKLQNVDLRNVEPGFVHRLDEQVVRLVNTAFSGPGVILFIAGVLFGLCVIAAR